MYSQRRKEENKMRAKFGNVNPIVIEHSHGVVTLKRAGKKVTLAHSDIKGVRHERKAVRGHCLVIETHNKPLYFKQSEGACKRAMAHLMELAQ